MKKMLLFVLSLCFIFTLAACGEEEVSEKSEKEKAPTDAPAVSDAAPDAPSDAPVDFKPASQRDKEIEDAIKSGKSEIPVTVDESEKDAPKSDAEKITVGTGTYASVAEFVTKRGQQIISDYAKNFGTGNCKCTIHAEGNSIVIKNCAIGVKNLSPEMKASMQSAYSNIGNSLKPVFQPLKKECASLESVIVHHCEEDGTPYTTITVTLD